MAGKAHGNGDRRGDNTICGLGDRLRRLTAGICLITQTIFPVMAAAPTHINPAHSDTAASLILPNVKTIPYTLGALESPPTVAARFGITVDELRRLNQFRTFARGFDNVRQGDEIDVPLINSNSPEARNLKAMQMERDGKDPQMQVAEMAQQSGTLLARDMDSEQAASMARGWVASSASAQATDWLSRWGTARVSLGVDEDFSLKSSSFEFLHPWYETPDNLVFSQHTLHRTDDRTQTNHGIGWRYFTSSWMSGVNMFIDHDLTRYHTRTGMGVEYWRDYLKLSGNGYLRLSNWRSAPELDNDYEARPANGWDLRAEGWLPAWPQLGGKLVYEQYYGDEVALFGKDERQNDPHAITAGLSYTPVPLISFSAEQRQGKQGENDTRIGMELTLQPGHSLQKQLDPAEVAARRSLVGSRYDLVDRNNNIVLEYRKKELVRLTLTDPLKGKPGEVKSLVSSLQTKYALKGYDIEAASLQSAGGKVAVSGKDIQVTIPPYRFTAMPETDNTYPIAVTAEDSKGNFSRREESMVVVEKPTLSLTDSTLSVDQQILLADGKSTSMLTYTARDSSGKPIPGMTLKTQVKGLQDFALSEWKDNGNGTYTQIVTAGKTSGALSLMPQFNGDDIAKTPALIAIVANTASRADSTIETDQDNYVAGKPIAVKVTLRDDNGNGVTGRKELLKQTVKVDNTKADAVSAWTEESEGIYKASYTAHLIGDKLTAQLTMPGWQTKHSDAFSIAGDKDTAKIVAMQITANNAVARRDHNTVAVTVRDVHQNLLQGQNVTFTVVNGAAVFADPNGGIVTTDKDGIARVNLASDQAVNSLIKAEINGSSQSVEVSFITGDISQLTSTIKTDDVSYTAGGKIKVSVTLMDEQKNLVKGMASLLAGSSVVEVSGTDKNETGNCSEESDGVYTTTRTAKIAGDRHYATLKLSTWSSAQQSDAYAIRESGAVLAYSSIVTDKTAYTAGGAIKVTVTLKDSYENLVGGQRDAISLAIQLPNTKAESIAWNEDQKGIYTATYTALLPGTGLKAQLQMSGWANALTSNDYSISGDAASAQIVAMQVTTGNPDVLANGSDRHTVNVRVEDQFGNVLPEQTVTFTVTKGAAVFANAGQSADIRTDAHGMAEVDLSSTVADASTVEAKINQSSDSKTVNFVADVSTAQIADLVVTQDGSVADGATANTLRARVTDVFGNALAGQTVSVLAGNGATTAPTVTTQPDGTVEISVTSQTAGTSVITASVNNSSQSRNVTFIADVSTAQIADLVVSQDNAVADGATANTLQVRVTDAFGNALAGQTVSVLADNGATVAPVVTTQPDGTVEISVTSQTAGSSAVTVSINSSSQSRDVTFIADVRTAQIADLVVIKDDSVAGNGATTAPTVTTQPDGTVEISVTSQTAGVSAVTATINSSTQSQNVTFIADVRTAQIADLVVIKDGSEADGATANTLRARVTDAFGNALAGQTVSVSADNGATTAPTVITEPDGTLEISVTSQTAGTSAVTASINNSSQSRNVTFIADVRTAQIAELVVIKDGSAADGVMANMLRARVTDAFGNALAGQTVSVLAGNGATTAPTVTTQPDGTLEISVTSQTAGISAVTATINNSTASQNVMFIADVRTAKIADLVVIKDDSVADGSTANTLQVKVTDANGNALAGQTVSVLAGNGATTAPTVTTQPDGTVEISVTSQTAGISAVTASINNSSQSRNVTFIADVSTAQIASLEVTQDNAVADGAMANTLLVRVTDAFGNTLAGQTVSVLADTGATVAPTVITGLDGTVEISVTSQTAGTSAVTASINSSTASRNVTFVADVRTAKIADLVVIKDGSVADGAMANTLRVKITDAFGNTLAGQTVSVLADNGATVAPTVITGQDGTVEISVTSQTAGTSTVTASINNSSQSRNVTFIADVRTAQIADLVVTRDNSVADGAMANTLRVRVTDAFGNVLAGQTVSVLADNGATVAPTVTTQPDGTVEISVTSQTAGISAVTASINNSSQSRNVTFVADVRTAQIADLVVIKDDSVADGSTANTLRARVTDAFGNALAGQTVSVLAGNGATTAPTVTTQPDGTVEISVTSQTAGISAVTASINSSSQSQNVTFVADVRTAKIADLVVIKDGSEADGSTANTLRARVTDAFGNALAGQTVSVLADNGATTAPTVITEPDGTVDISVTSQTAGISTVTATINSSSQSQNVTFIADIRTAQIASLEVTQDNAVADGAMANTLQVKITDAFGNTLGGQTVSVLADNGATVAPVVTTQPDGTVEISVTSQTAGVSAVTATINSSTQSQNVTFIADVRTAKIADLVVIKDGSEADGSTANTLRARVTDAFGNALGGQTVSVMADNGATTAPTVITEPDGTVEISVTSRTAGISAVTATINNSSLSRNVTFVADVRTAKIADLVVTQDGSVADGSTANTLRARVTDAFGNALGGQTVSVMADNGATTAPTVITEPDGTVEISVTSRTAGISTVTATINSSSLSRNVTFVADVRTAQIADLVVIKDGSEADGATANTLRARVTDAFGNALAGQTVSVMADNGATTAPTVITEPDGTVEISVTSRTAGISTVTATINSSSQSQNVTFIADIRTAQIASLEVTQDNSVADGTMANTLRVKITDAFGNTLGGQTVSVLADNGATTAPTVTTQPDDTVEISVTSQTAGTSAVTASINSSTASRNVTFVADVRTAKIADLVVIKDGSEADGATANTLRARVTDAFGNALAGQTVSVSAGNSATVAPAVITEPDGTVDISVTSQTAGISTVTATINNHSLSQSVMFIADVRTAQIADLVVIKDGSEADGATANTLRARVTDAFGNALAGQTVSVSAGNSATTAPTVITEPDGTVEISVTSRTAGISTVTATINSSSQSQNVTFIADIRTAQIADLVVIKDGSEADGSTANTLRARVTDAFGNALAGQMVSVLAGNGATTAPTVTTQPDGTVEISVTSQTAGTSAVTASINNSSQSRNVTFIADVSTAQIASLEVTQDNAVADGATANTLRARVTDAFGNALAGQTVSVMAGNSATVAPAVITEPDGTVEISVTSQTAGISTVTATINNHSLSQSVMFIADVRTAQIADLVVIKDGSEADGATANTLRARVTDAFGNALAGQTVSVLADNGATTAPTVITEPDGTVEISVTSQTAGTSAVTASINNSSQSRNVTFIADVSTAQIADLVVTQDGSVADGSTANMLRVRVTDAFGNTLAGQTVSVLADNGATVAPTVITEPDGTVEISVTSQTAGISTVTATINNSTLSQNVTFIADVSTAKIADLVVIKDGSAADGATANTLQARVTDAFGNALAGQTVSVLAGNGATVAPTVTTQPDGTVEISVTSQTAGVSAVTATINNSSQSQYVTFVPGDASQLTSTVETNKSNYTVGETITITVTLRDAFDNLVTGAASQLAADGVLTVAGTDPSETGSWVESGGVYTTTRMATIASTNQHANLQLQTWSDGVTSDRYDIQSGSPAQATSTIATDKNAYTAGDTITVAVTLKDAHGNLVEGGESLLSGDNVTVEGAVRSGGWSETAGVYTATWSAQMAGDSHHATLKLSEWGSSKQSESYSIHSGAPVQANSAIRTDKLAYIAGEPLTVTITLRDEFGNPALGLTSEVIESYIDNFAVGGATPDSMQWVEQNNGEYTIVWTAWVAEENLVASLKLKTWATEIKSSLYGIQPGAAAKTQSTIVADKTIYIAGDSITVTVVLKDAQGNFITDGVVQLNEENVQVRNADSIQGNNWIYNGNGQYQRQYMAHFAEANLNAQLKMAGWSDANYSNNYTIKPGEVSPLGSQLRIREVLVVEGADLPVSVLLVDDFGNPVDNGLDLLDDAVYLQNVEKKEGEKWRYVGDGIYERTYMAYQEGENLTSFMEIKGWRIYGQPSYTILPFVEVELLSVNGVKFRATDGFPETGFDGAKFTLLLTHNMKNTDYNWTAGIYGINVDSNGEVTLSVLIRSEVTITGKPKNGKGNDVVFKFKIKKWFTSLGATSSNTWDIINTSCSYGQMPSSLELAQRPSGGVVPRKVGTLWGEYGNLKTYGNAFSGTDYWTSTQLMGVHEKFNPETGISELGTGKSSGLCVEYY
ncbi:TPA: inverse autotransporter adhesin IatC [Escherichia coli]